MAQRRQSGFTLIELLVVVAIIAIVASIALANYLSALDRAKQKRTMSDIRVIATAWEARAADVNGYGTAGYTFPANDVSFASLQTALTPTYTRALPRYDGWNHDYIFAYDAQGYAIRSTGSDGKPDGEITPGGKSSPDCDIVYSNGTFICYPEGVQSKQ